MYLFITLPNNSGSTLMFDLIATSPNVATLTKQSGHTLEGHDVVRDHMPHPGKLDDQPVRTFTEAADYFTNPSRYNWEEIKKGWHGLWDMSKPVLLEKTPNNCLKVQLLAKYMQPAKFIIGMREPYSFCHSMLSYHVHDVKRSARHWMKCAEAQIDNMNKLYSQCILINYEDLAPTRYPQRGRS